MIGGKCGNMKNIYENEENIKNKVIVPFFKKLGFNSDEVEFETNLKIMIPRKGKIQIGDKIAKNVFSDIVYSTYIEGTKKNIFIVEVKRSDHKITETDIEQAICYARLLEDIPPFSIVTNGNDTQVFDSITKEPIDDLENSKFKLSGYKITINEEIQDEALRLLIGLNSTNLINFCNLQSSQNLKEIASENISTKRIIEQVHCNRKKYMDDFKEFLKSEYKVYALIGKSGYGKTNHIYSILNKYKNEMPFIFYNAGVLGNSIKETIKEDFEFILKRNYSLVELVNKFDKITKGNNKKMFIVIDGLDEYSNITALKNELNDLVKKIIDTNIYLIISCKITDESNDLWYEITSYKGSLNAFGSNIYNSKNLCYPEKIGVFIDKLDNNELNYLWHKYKKVFNLQGSLEREIKEISKEPFILRMVSEVYQNDKIEKDITEAILYKKWLNKKLDNMSDSNMCKYLLNKIVQLCVKSKREKLEYEEAIDLVSNINSKYEYLNSLILEGILIVYNEKDDRKYLSLCNKNFSYYIYTYECMKWNDKNLLELKDHFNNYINDEYLRPIIIFFISSIQNNYNKDKEVWSDELNIYEEEICGVCGRRINKYDHTTLVLDVNLERLKNEMRMGDFITVHKKCLDDIVSPLAIVQDQKNIMLNIDDILQFYKIINVLKYMPESRII